MLNRALVIAVRPGQAVQALRHGPGLRPAGSDFGILSEASSGTCAKAREKIIVLLSMLMIAFNI